MPTIKPNSAQKISRNSGKLATCVCFQFFYNNNSICAITFKQLIGLEWNQLHLKDNNKTYNFFVYMITKNLLIHTILEYTYYP